MGREISAATNLLHLHWSFFPKNKAEVWISMFLLCDLEGDGGFVSSFERHLERGAEIQQLQQHVDLGMFTEPQNPELSNTGRTLNSLHPQAALGSKASQMWWGCSKTQENFTAFLLCCQRTEILGWDSTFPFEKPHFPEGKAPSLQCTLSLECFI